VLVKRATAASMLLLALGCCSCRDFTLGAPDNGGASGAASDAGLGNQVDHEPTLVASCEIRNYVAVQVVVGLGVALSDEGDQWVLYSWDQPTSTTVYRVSHQLAATQWDSWQCLDPFPGVTRLAAMNLSNRQPELFAVAATGQLFARRDGTNGWSPWLPFSLPSSSSRVSDVAVVSSDQARVFAVDRGRVLVRQRVSAAPYSDYGPWQGLESNRAKLVTALERSDGSHQVLSVDDEGAWQTALEMPGDESFGAWSALPAPPEPAIDIAAVDGGALVAYALDGHGTIWMNPELPEAPWGALSVPDALGPIVAIAASVIEGTPRVFGVDAAGNVFASGASDSD
jgi:hypothetical protein